MTSALVYARKSTPDPRSTGRSRSVDEQIAEARSWAEREGWTIVGVEVDDSVSASRHSRKPRPAWEAVKTALRANGADVLMTWEASRATRDLEVYAELRRLCAETGTLWAYEGKVHDLTERDARFRTGLDALVAEDEAERTRERVLRAMRANAHNGRPHGRRAYGYRRVYDSASGALLGQEPDPEESPIVAEIVERVARGDSMRHLAHELNLRGLTTAHGFAWSASTVRRTARNLHYAGLRIHGAEELPGTWPAIVDEQLIRSAINRTNGNTRSRAMPTSEVRHLLSGLARCGRCGAKLFRAHDRKGVHVYACRERDWTDPETGKRYGIGHLTVRKAPADLLVTEAVAAYLERGDVAAMVRTAATPHGSPAVAEAAELRRRMADAVQAFTSGHLSAATLGHIESDLLPRIERAEASARRSALPPAVAEALGQDFRALPLGNQREVISALAVVTIAPGKPTRTFDPDRVNLQWRV